MKKRKKSGRKKKLKTESPPPPPPPPAEKIQENSNEEKDFTKLIERTRVQQKILLKNDKIDNYVSTEELLDLFNCEKHFQAILQQYFKDNSSNI